MNVITKKLVGTTCFAMTALALAIGSATAASPSPDAAVQALAQRSAPATAPLATEDQLARAQAKFAQALSIADQFKDRAAAEGITGDNWRFEMVGNMMKGSQADFAGVALARSYTDAMSASVQISRIAPSSAATDASAKSLGAATTDLVYVPITPCRILDTRPTFIPASTPKTYFYTASNVGAGSCSVTNQIPGSTLAAAFAANVTLDETGLTGFAAGAYIQLYPQGGSTTTSFMNFGPNQIIANAGIISLNQANSEFTVFTSAPANVIIDTYGAFIAPQPTALACGLVYAAQALTSSSASNYYYSTAVCPAGRSAVAPYCYSGDQAGIYSAGSGINGSPFCSWINLSGAATSVYDGQLCCGVPGR
jgi:hypothetical protein